MFCGPVRVPNNAGAGFAKITLSMPDWKEGDVTPGTFKGLITGDSRDIPKIASLLHDRDQDVRAEAISAITTSNLTAIPALLEQLKTSPKNNQIVDELTQAMLRAMGVSLRYKADKLTYVALINRPDVAKDVLKLLRSLPDNNLPSDLTDLNLYGGQITDDGLRNIEDLKNLNSLVLSQNPITDDGLRHVAGLTKLTFLNLEATQITDDGLRHLENLASLDFLVLAENRITDDGLNHIANLPKLTSLTAIGLSGTQITNVGLVHLKKLKNLKRLYVSKTRITSTGLALLTDMQQLEALSLSESSVDDAAIVHLAKLKNLRRLELQGYFTNERKAELSRRLPNCGIKYWR